MRVQLTVGALSWIWKRTKPHQPVLLSGNEAFVTLTRRMDANLPICFWSLLACFLFIFWIRGIFIAFLDLLNCLMFSGSIKGFLHFTGQAVIKPGFDKWSTVLHTARLFFPLWLFVSDIKINLFRREYLWEIQE